MTTIAFTGHRPKDLPAGFSYSSFTRELERWLTITPEDMRFMCGGALGIDSWAAEYAMRNGIPFDLALPFRPRVMSNRWPIIAVDRLRAHIAAAETVHIINDTGAYDVRAYQLRNEFMVNAADHVLAFWSGKPYGGTANCIRYALQVDRPVTNLLPGRYQGAIKEMM